jgi:hypothetical protein
MVERVPAELEDAETDIPVDRAKVERGATALLPFVQAWNLALNPEQLDLMSFAVLKHTDETSSASLTEVINDVQTMIDEDKELQDRMFQAMRSTPER